MISWVSSLLCTTKTGLKISFMPSEKMPGIPYEKVSLKFKLVKETLLMIKELKLPAFKKNTYVFLQLRCLVLFNSFGMRIADFQRYMKHHGRCHASSTFWRNSYVPKIGLACFLVDQKKFPVANPHFFQGNPPSVWEWDVWCDLAMSWYWKTLWIPSTWSKKTCLSSSLPLMLLSYRCF